MSIQDSSPERRNLLVLSMGIIIFYLAGGEFIDQSVRLQIINVKFANPDMLKSIVWVLLLWFIFRYWVTMRGTWSNPFYSEVNYLPAKDSIIYSYIVKRFDLTDDLSNALDNDRHYVLVDSNQNPTSETRLKFKHVYKTAKGQANDFISATTIMDKLVVMATIIRALIFKPTLTTYFMPYFLAAIAIVLGACNSF